MGTNMPPESNDPTSGIPIHSSARRRITTRLVVKTAPGVGLRAHVGEEVIHVSLAVLSSEEAAALVSSHDPRKPSVYHSSRDAALDIAKSLKLEIDACGFAGPCMDLVIPGIPFDQTQDAGIHLSIYNRPGSAADGIKYLPPAVEIAKSMQGKQVDFELEG